ncbi:hypothetical protein [Mongoliitalea daihaiensis]|uniref:hypothetical protein n=1 Tax=Mongoliitalea daihaiensis TaxID=2782006 RepID=UPI001F180B55|nr:hypothetical protein [Mongoliitalea daihaiensis]UJP66662.1 hypothetical protein IPZ59_08775 [Mongoliitalea daihaiensis]
MKNQDLKQAFQLISKDFELEEKSFADYEDLLIKLTEVVRQLLNRDFEKLLQICYRIDLGEQELNRLLYKTDPESMAEEIAASLIKRQLKKVEIRKKYSP